MLINNEFQHTYNLDIRDEKVIHKTTFSISNHGLKTSCSCGQSHLGSCKHITYILAGRRRHIVNGQWQSELINKVAGTKDGMDLLNKATASVGHTETCRRCNSTKVIMLKKSAYGKFIAYFKPSGHGYYCKSCGWSW